MNGARVELVSRIGAIMAHGDPTPFAFEGALRHGIRGGLLLSGRGWTWAGADAAAAAIVGEALGQIGAKRPTWLQGQPEYTLWRTSDLRCIRCHRDLPDEGRTRYFCSKLCADSHKAARYRAIKGATHAAERKAAYHAAKAAAPVERCAVCGTAVQRSQRNGRNAVSKPVCSPRCRGKLGAMSRTQDFVL